MGRGHSPLHRPLLQWGGDTPSPHSTPLAPPAPRTSHLWLWPPLHKILNTPLQGYILFSINNGNGTIMHRYKNILAYPVGPPQGTGSATGVHQTSCPNVNSSLSFHFCNLFLKQFKVLADIVSSFQAVPPCNILSLKKC